MAGTAEGKVVRAVDYYQGQEINNLTLTFAGGKLTSITGSGPGFEKMKAAYPKVSLLGPKHGAELASIYTAADVFVFPSRTDTFGLVNIEALACGVPSSGRNVRPRIGRTPRTSK